MEGGTRGTGGGHGPPKILENPYTHTAPSRGKFPGTRL